MKPRIALTLVALGTLALSGNAIAGIERAGTTSANFLSVGSGAGILGMGGATLGWGGDLSAVAWNPAALGWVNGTQVVISHAGVADQTSQEFAAVGGHFLPLRSHWALSGLYHGDGSFDGRDASGISTGTFGVSSMAIGGTLSRGFAGIATVGVGAKFVSEKLGDVSGIGGTFDAGVMVRTGPFGIGAAAQNVGGRMQYGNIYYPMPTNFGIGGSYEHPGTGLRVALDFDYPNAYYSDVRTGLEWRWRDRLALRTGYRRELGGASDDPLNGPTFGLGAGAHGMWFDYGYLVGGNGEGQHRLGITFHPGGLLSGDGASAGYGSTVRPEKPAGPTAPPSTGSWNDAPKATPQAEKPAGPPASPSNGSWDNPPKAAPRAVEPAPRTAPVSARPSVEVAPAGAKPAIAATDSKSAPAHVAPSVPQVPIAKPTSSPMATPVEVSPPTLRSETTVPSATPSRSSRAASAPTTSVKKATPIAPVASPTPEGRPAPTAPIEETRSAPTSAAPGAKSAPTAVTPETRTEPTPAEIKAAPAAPTSEVKPASESKPAPTASAPEARPATAAPTAEPKPATVAPAPETKPTTAPAASATPRPAKVKVKKGETLLQIAQRWGTSPAAIMMENNLTSENVRSGQTLKLPQR